MPFQVIDDEENQTDTYKAGPFAMARDPQEQTALTGGDKGMSPMPRIQKTHNNFLRGAPPVPTQTRG